MNNNSMPSCKKQGVGSSLSKNSKKDKKWDHKKKEAMTVSEILTGGAASDLDKNWRVNFGKWAESLSGCAYFLKFGQKIDKRTGEIGEYKLSHAFFCKKKACAVCDWRKSLMRQSMFLSEVPEIIKEHKGGRWLFLTLTVPNCPIENLREVLSDMSKAWARMMDRAAIKKYVLGTIRRVEVTKEKKRDGYAHPHYHCLIFVKGSYFSKGYLSQAKWAELWRESMRSEEFLSVNVKAVRNRKGADGGLDTEVYAGLVETLKTFNYSVKVADLDVSDEKWLLEYYRQTHKLRMLASSGLFFGIFSESEKATDEDLIKINDDQDGEKFDIESVYWYGVGRGYLLKSVEFVD